MIGLVLVSHSRALAEALASLVRQVSPGELPIALAAGSGENRQEFGTDTTEILEAIQSVYSSDGVLVLMDLGSAVLSAEMALDLLPGEMQGNVRLCAGPLVEGAIAAAVSAGAGFDLNSVFQEAGNALVPKAEHLRGGVDAGQVAPGVGVPDMSQGVTLTLQNPHGLHARPAARFVQLAASFKADIRVTDETSAKGPVSALSLNALATLGALKGHRLRISASGPEAKTALEALSRLIESGFGEAAVTQAETPATHPDIPVVPGGAISAIPISEGIAIGPARFSRPMKPVIPDYTPISPEAEWESLQGAIAVTRIAIEQRRQRLRISLGEEKSAIFEAHLLILQDPDLLKNVRSGIFARGENAAQAWQAAIDQIVSAYYTLEDAYLRQRSADVSDVGNQVLMSLIGDPVAPSMQFSEPVVLLAEEITPGEAAQLDLNQVLGLITAVGGVTSHGAILARALGIPALSGVNISELDVTDGVRVALDGAEGVLWIDPDAKTLGELDKKRNAWLEQWKRRLRSSHEPACTRDGRRIQVAANVGSLPDAKAAAKNGAEGIGVLRTEFLYLRRTTPPGEEEQLDTLREIARAMGDYPIIVRTLDVGGDKDLPYISLSVEANPFLGVRGLRLSFRQPEIFLPQLRAILRAGADFHTCVMFPMVAALEEVLQARALLEQAHQALEREKLPHCWPVEVGIMVETPAAALLSPILASHVDFFSLGTNDLTQYTLAAERGNPQLEEYHDTLHPAVLQQVKRVVEAAHQHGKWAGVCGEVAGDPLATPVLLGVGVDELSMNPAAVPQVKEMIRQLDSKSVKALAEKALCCASAGEVRGLARKDAERIVEAYKR